LRRRDLAASIFLQLHNEVDCVDAVQVEIVRQARLEDKLVRRQIEQIVEVFRENHRNLVLRDYQLCSCPFRYCARVRTVSKIPRISSFDPCTLILYFLLIATPSSNPSIESSPSPSTNNA